MEGTNRKLFVQIIGQILIADGALTDGEREHLDHVMDSLQMPAQERRPAMSGISMDSPIGDRVRALDSSYHPRLLEEAEKAARADGNMGRSEEQMLQAVREATG